MPRYIVTRSFYEGNGLHEEGNAFEHQDQAYIEKCLADGNIQVVEGSESSPATPVSETPADQGVTATPAPLEVASDSSSEETPQQVTPVEQAPVPQVPVTPQPQEPTPAPVNPTQAEIDETLRASGLESSSSNASDEVQIS